MTRGQWITGLIFAGMVLTVVATMFFPLESREAYDKKERAVHMEMIKRNSERIQRLSLDSLTIRQKMYSDSIRFSEAIKAKDAAFIKQRKHYESINFSRSTIPELDSIRARLLTLHPVK